VKIPIVEYDSRWVELYRREAERIRGALGERALRVEHAGSTAVPGLPAKPVIDVVLAVADSGDEGAYLPDLERAGYVLRFQEPEWYQHRLLNGPEAEVNLHVFSAACEEVARMVAFRDWLRENAADRDLYARTKLELAAREWSSVQEYAEAKTAVIGEIMGRANPSGPTSEPGQPGFERRPV